MLSRWILAGLSLVMTGCSQGRDLNVSQEAPAAVTAESANELVHVQGKFVSIEPTGKRHQSFIFTFQTEFQLHGPHQGPTPIDELIRFEMAQDSGGRDLVVELSGQNPQGGMALEDAARSVTDSSAYQLVLWRLPSPRASGDQQIDAQLLGEPVLVHFIE